jgi:hypothetical protein
MRRRRGSRKGRNIERRGMEAEEKNKTKEEGYWVTL